MSNSLDPDQAKLIVGPDLGPKCLQRLFANDSIKELVQKSKCTSNLNARA